MDKFLDVAKVSLLLLLAILLASCQSTPKRKDGPPHFYIDERKIPDAMPKAEPLAKHGNMPHYRVFGQRYYVMKSCKNYSEIGTASWYGTMFHNRRTSSGERYNLAGMTAAHRTLPLPTYVEVTNLRNKKKIIVKVNDRGPFASNRIIDLSYVAAKKLDMIGKGTARVKIRALDPSLHLHQKIYAQNHLKYKKFTKKIEQKTTLAKTDKKIIQLSDKTIEIRQTETKSKLETINLAYLQVGAFKDKLNAIKLQQRLANLLSAPIKIILPKTANQLYRVHIGPIRDMATMKKVTQQLESLGIAHNKTNGV